MAAYRAPLRERTQKVSKRTIDVEEAAVLIKDQDGAFDRINGERKKTKLLGGLVLIRSVAQKTR